MDLLELSRHNPNVMITIRLGDLIEANKRLIVQSRAEGRRDAERASELDAARELIPRKDLIKMLHVDPSTLWDWANNGYLVPVKIGRKCYYRPEEVEAAIRRHQRSAV